MLLSYYLSNFKNIETQRQEIIFFLFEEIVATTHVQHNMKERLTPFCGGKEICSNGGKNVEDRSIESIGDSRKLKIGVRIRKQPIPPIVKRLPRHRFSQPRWWFTMTPPDKISINRQRKDIIMEYDGYQFQTNDNRKENKLISDGRQQYTIAITKNGIDSNCL